MIGTGDESGLGQVTVLLYGLAALLALGCAVRAAGRGELRFWIALCLACVAFGANKQADMQTELIAWSREASKAAQLYEWRRPVQAVLVLVLGTGAMMIGWAMLRWRPPGALGAAALAGLVGVLLYACLRAAQAGHVLDEKAAVLAIHLLEPAALIVIASAALGSLARRRS